MRAYLFRKLLNRIWRQRPHWFASLQLQILLGISARAYRMPGKIILFLNPQRALRKYASYTVRCMESGTEGEKRLYKAALSVGTRIRQITGFTQKEDLRRLIILLYRNIGITLKGQLPGNIAITRCYFSRYYTPEQCRVMSNVDAGVIAGIFGGGNLVFTERITEGCKSCKACLKGSVR